MCDTIAASGSVTADGITLFGKNSEREPNEDYQKSMQYITPQRDKLEADLLKQALSTKKTDLTERQSLARQAFEKARNFDDECHAALKSLSVVKSNSILYSHAWRKWNKAAGLPFR